ncbi:DNA polymerase epsilon catalytic subunit A [[Candida] anglica]|uniref:DNA polymerase epsilon catalytic subunit n=1 Tax=[Candida] anglica TaxID=148631 RepID=A0ABP0EC05_9ASCO
MPPFKGSTSARFVKNKGSNGTTLKSEYRSDTKREYEVENISPMSTDSSQRLEMVTKIDKIDSIMGFDRIESSETSSNKPKKGWLVNMHATTVPTDDYLAGYSGVDYYFLDEEGGSFKATIQFDPYFYLASVPGHESEVEETIRKLLEQCHLKSVARLNKEDLSLPNHLVGLQKSLIKLTFHNVSDLLAARRLLSPIVKDNQLTRDSRDIYMNTNFNVGGNTVHDSDYGQLSGTYSNNDHNSSNFHNSNNNGNNENVDPLTFIDDIREYDVPYHVRVSIDKNIRVGKWYNVYVAQQETSLEEDKEKIAFADPVVLAFDIETTKAPLKFPDAAHDQIMMISYMIDGEGFLITNRSIVSQDIEDFEYTPKPEYPGNFTIFNEDDEKALLERFFEHIRDARPTVIATFNGDFFDWPFVDKRTSVHNMDLFEEIGFAKDNEGEYKSKYCVHMDCYRWVKRDSYLPQGSQGLKAVTTAKLGYNPTELDPELMTPYAYEKPQLLSEYSVSDAVATYYLYYKYVHPFIFSLCTIIPLNPDEVLRKGTGTLCEMLLMVQAYEKGILLPNKHSEPIERFYEGHLLESETYVGGHVESLEAGVFRSDIPCDFKVDPTAIDELINDLHSSLKFCVEVENNKKMEDVENFDEVYNDIKQQLLLLRDAPVRTEVPLIYHVDVASMYPNIMTSNRLQPDSMKTEEDCAACDFNRPQKNCDRKLPWAWRGEFFPATASDYNTVKNSVHAETFPSKKEGGPRRMFEELPYAEQAQIIKKRVSDYSKANYHRIKQTKTVERTSIVCQRENPFYVDTVRSFRDRRYEFKTLAKVWKGKSSKIAKSDPIGKDEANKMVVLYDSLQLAHKVILNSFYGYVMRKGSRWYSMEMAGITCLTGAHIIQMARKLVERIGRPLELDTDGIWCILPKSFPENFHLKCKDGKKLFVEYPCSMLNYLVHQQFTNHQYQDLVDPENFKYKTRSDNSIFFEVDGPYKAMILPTSKEEGKGLKKRYAVFNDDGTLAELKGFELKRRGELQLIKNFQSDIFKLFLDGDSLESCYKAVANVANNWLDVLDTKGGMLEDEDLIELICENRSMSKSLKEYGNQKSTSITTARRLGEFLGEEMVKDAGLACKYIISSRPIGSPVTERAIPVSIFSSEKKKHFLRKWLKDPRLEDFDPRSVLDWDYYRLRLSSVVQKIISIPAALQGVKNPVPRVEHPDWLRNRIKVLEDPKKQSSIGAFFKSTTKNEALKQTKAHIKDIEDFGDMDISTTGHAKIAKVTSTKRKGKRTITLTKAEALEQEEENERQRAILNGPCPSMDDYVAFLNYQKAKWKLQQANKESRRKVFGTDTNSSHRSALGGMIQKHATSLAGSNWEVLQYKPDPMKPGDIKVYVSASGKVHTFTFQIPKKFYASFKTELSRASMKKLPTTCQMETSNAVLPNGHDASNLYKFVMPELTFQEEVTNVESVLQSSNLLGLYETQIGSVERAIVELGNSVKFDDTKVGALGKGLQNGFHLRDMTKVDNENYLRRFNMDIVYLLHLVTNSYEFFAVFKSWESSASIFVLKPSSNAQELPGNLNKIYQEIFSAKQEKIEKHSAIINYPESMEFETTYFQNDTKLFKKLNSYISKVHEERSNQALFAIQSPYTEKIMNFINVDFPTIKMNVSELSLPAISWQTLISKRIINHYFVLASWVKNLIALSKYGNIPLCNLQIENMGYLIDIEYARRLSTNNIVLWWSPKPLPDHGGFEMDRAQDLESLEFPTINNPDVYETACLEVGIGTLTINTILTSALINEAEGSDLAEENVEFDHNNGASTIAEDSFSAPALSILRGMVKNWWDDALKNNINADSMMNSLVTWVQRRDSHLYDFALHYHVHNLTTKALLQLIGEFKRMNASVVFASRNKLIVQTSKVSVENSYAYGQYIIKTARKKPLFSFLDMRITKYWDILLWMDEYNYGGRCCYEITNEDVQDLVPESNWQIKNYLPVLFQDEFEDWLIIFLDALTNNKSVTMLGGSTQTQTQRVTQISHIIKGQKKLVEQEGESQGTENIDQGVLEQFRKPLISRIEKLLRRQNESILNPELSAEYEFPKLPGSHLSMVNPSLELVKFLIAVFGLSRKRNIEVRVLRKDLLSLFDIKEFSSEGVFRNPSTSLKVPQVVCDYCNYIKDIDFCRDSDHDIWNCGSCNKKYNPVAIEEQLIAEYCKLLTRFYVQDLKCSKCQQIKSDNLSPYCQCSGKWIETISSSEIEKKKSVFTNVATVYNLSLLRGLLE